MPADATDKHAAAQQAVDILHEISTILVSFSLPPVILSSLYDVGARWADSVGVELSS